LTAERIALQTASITSVPLTGGVGKWHGRDLNGVPAKGARMTAWPGRDAVPAVDDLLGQVSAWAGRTVRWTPLPGGLSHHVYRVVADDVSYVLRVLQPAVSAAGLGIAPAVEIDNTRAAAATGVGAAVIEVLPHVPALVLEFLPGRTLTAADVRDPARTGAIAAACRRLHAGPRFGNDFDIFAKRTELLALCDRHGLPLPPGYLDHEPAVERIRSALAASPLPPVPCHNDLLAENFIEHRQQVRIIDYQLSGNNDPTFELGDIAAEADFDPDGVGRLAAAYFSDELTAALVARVRLQLAASNATWALWFTVHSGLLSGGGAGFDYTAEAADKWGQAVRDLTAPDLGRLLDTAAGRRPAASPS
jgi:thiamine kinase-like enzyme